MKVALTHLGIVAARSFVFSVILILLLVCACLQGGDGSLSGKGEEFAQNLNRFIESLPPSERPQSVWISSLKRTGETAKYLRKIPKVSCYVPAALLFAHTVTVCHSLSMVIWGTPGASARQEGRVEESATMTAVYCTLSKTILVT